MRMRLASRILATASSLAACLVAALSFAGCGGGGSGGGVDPGPTYWAIPLLADSSRPTLIFARNLLSSGASVTFQGYREDGLPYSGPVTVVLDGFGEHSLAVTDALGGDAQDGGWILVTTPTMRVEVGFEVSIPGKNALEAARAWPLPDLVAPPPSWTAGLTVTSEATRLQVGNATALPIVVAVTAYREPADPLLPPIVSTPAPIALAPFESKTFSPDGLSGIGGFVGSFSFSSSAPIFAAIEEDLAFGPSPQVQIESRIMEIAVDWGQETFVPAESWTDFAVVLHNDQDRASGVTFQRVDFDSGTPLLLAPRTVGLAAHESRVITTRDFPFDDILGDPTLQPSLLHLSVEITVAGGVELSFRQFDPVALSHNMTARPHALGHVFETLGVFPSPGVPAAERYFASILNPNDGPIDVTVSSVIPQPDDFDAGPIVLTVVTLAAHERIDFSPDGFVYLDRDGIATSLVGFRFTSPRPFAVTGRHEVRVGGFIAMLSPLLVRNHEDAE